MEWSVEPAATLLCVAPTLTNMAILLAESYIHRRIAAMARKVHQVISDDVDGSPDAKTIEFRLDSVPYEIDLASKNEKALRLALAPYLDVARTIRAEGRGSEFQLKASNKERNTAIREWALENGLELPSRGRIAGAVAEAFDASDVDALYAAVGIEREPAKPTRRRKPESPAFSGA
jgi:hypothetical protein